jgi:outer membrane protein TolC
MIKTIRLGFVITFWFASSTVYLFAQTGQIDPLGYSISTPRPIDPATATTNPSALATQKQNPYLGSAPSGKATQEVIDLSLSEAIARGLRYNLGLIESTHAAADVRAQRLRSLSGLLPEITLEGKEVTANQSLKEFGLKLPPIPGFPGLPATSGAFGFQDVRVSMTQRIYDSPLQNKYRAGKQAELASAMSTNDARDVVVYAVGTAYFQIVASAARVETSKAQLASARELDRQTGDRVEAQLSPEIDSLRSRVERQTVEQQVVNAINEMEKAKLALARIIGLPVGQQFTASDPGTYRALSALTEESAIAHAQEFRSDLLSAAASIREAEYRVRSEKAQRLPVFSMRADYGGAGVNAGAFSQVYTIAGQVSLPIYTGGRIRADIEGAETYLTRRQAEYDDLEGRIAYDVRVAWLDMQASDSSVKVAESNKALANRALLQSQDRYLNGVANYLEVLRAQESVAAADENYTRSLYSFNLAKMALARAMGAAEGHIQDFFGGQ